MQLKKINIVLDSISATTTQNFALVDQHLFIGQTNKTIKYARLLNIDNKSYRKKLATAEVLQVQDVTFTGTANSTTYVINISQTNQTTGNIVSQDFVYKTDATGTITVDDIAAGFVAMINGADKFKITASNVAGVMTLTAQTGFATFTVTKVAEPSSGNISIAAPSTAGVVAFGYTPYYDLLEEGVPSTSIGGAAAGYTLYQFDYTVDSDVVQTFKNQINLWLNSSATNYAGLVTAIDAIFAQAAFNQETFQVG